MFNYQIMALPYNYIPTKTAITNKVGFLSPSPQLVAVKACNRVATRNKWSNGYSSVKCQSDIQSEVAFDVDTTNAANLLKTALDPASGVLPADIVKSFKTLESKKLKFEEWGKKISSPDGACWNLIYITPKEYKNNGLYFPLTAMQKFKEGKMENGVYIKHRIASLKFSGSYSIQNRALRFSFDQIKISLGPFSFTFPIKSSEKFSEGTFVLFYIDDEIIVLRGQSGGTAFWKRVYPSWLLENGID